MMSVYLCTSNGNVEVMDILRQPIASPYPLIVCIVQWKTDLTGAVLAGGTVGDAGAALDVFEDHFLLLDDQLLNTACE